MKRLCLLLLPSLMILYEVNCFHHPHHRKRSKHLMKRFPNSKPPLSGVGDRETLKEALQLLNVGKKTLGLNTEDPDLLLQLVENPNEKNKSETIEKLLEDPKQIPHAPIGKQFLALSGENGKVKVDNFTNVTPNPNEKIHVPSNDSDIQDVFKMIMEKNSPDTQSKVFHKITIIETNQLKPYLNKESSHTTRSSKRRRRHKGFHLARKFHTRQKRSKLFPLSNYLHRKHSVNVDETPFFRIQTPKKRNSTNWRDDKESRIEISLSKFPGPGRVNKRVYGSETFRDTENNFLDKELSPSGNHRFEKKANIKEGRGKPNIAGNNFRLDDENLEKLIYSIGFASSQRTIITKTTVRTSNPKGDIFSTVSRNKPFKSTTKATNVVLGTQMQKRDVFPSLDLDRYAIVERILPLEQGKESISSHVLEVAAIMIITLVCFTIILVIYSKLSSAASTPHRKTTEKRKDRFQSNIRELGKNYPYSGMYCYKTAFMEEDDRGFRGLEWQSESGDWLSDIEEKDKL